MPASLQTVLLVLSIACGVGLFYGIAFGVAHMIYTPFRHFWRKLTGIPQLMDRQIVRAAALQAAKTSFQGQTVTDATVQKVADSYEQAITLYLMCIDDQSWRVMKERAAAFNVENATAA